MIELLEKLVSINSISPYEPEIGNFLYKYLEYLGFKVEKQYALGNRFNLLAEKGEGENALLLYGHMDTVPINGKWKDSPFSLRINEDKAIGLGTGDMKGGIAAILEAAENFVPQNYKLKICFSVDEENFSRGAFKVIESPWVGDVRGVLIPETSLPASKSENAGSLVTIGRKGRVVFTIKIFGETAHGVNPERGINAIEQASKLVIEINNFPKTFHPEMGSSSFYVRKIHGKTTSLSIPDFCELEIDFHIVPPDNSNIILEKLHNYIETLYQNGVLIEGIKKFELKFSPRPTPFLEPFLLSKNEPFVELAKNAVEKVYGISEYNFGQSVADENVFGILGIPVLTIGPVADNHHSAEEWVSISSLEKLRDIYRFILEDFEDFGK